MWEGRCYEKGIPDQVPYGLIGKGRVPSYQEIAIAILRNDNNLKSLGFSVQESELVKNLRQSRKSDIEKKESGQTTIFDAIDNKL